MEKTPKNAGTLEKWARRLRGRSRMAVATIGGIFAIGFFFVSRPLGQRIDFANERLTRAEARMQLAGDVADLRRQSALYQKKLPRGVDLNDWTQFLLQPIRAQRVRLSRMDPKDQLSLGPCRVLSWTVELEGDFASLAKVVEAFENSERLIRIDRLVLQNAHGHLTLSMVVRGLALDASAGKDKEKEKSSPTAGGVHAVPVSAAQSAQEHPGK